MREKAKHILVIRSSRYVDEKKNKKMAKKFRKFFGFPIVVMHINSDESVELFKVER